MTFHSTRRKFAVETLSPRVVLDAQSILEFENQISDFVINSRTQVDVTQPSEAYFRKVSWIVDNLIQTAGLHPDGSKIRDSLQSIAMPTGAVDSIIAGAFDADSGYGFAIFQDGSTEGVLWNDPNTPILLGDVQPLAGYQLADDTLIVALESNSTVRVVHFAVDGQELKSVILDGDVYSNAIVTSAGLIVLGSEQDQPLAVRVNNQLEVQYVTLELPSGADFATPVGVSHVAGQDLLVGSTIDAVGETRLVIWNDQGNVVPQPSLDSLSNLWALKVSGAAMLVDTEQGTAVIVRDPSLANSLGIAVDVPVLASELPSLKSRNYVESALTELTERDGEIFLGFIATDASGSLVHGLLVASSRLLPSAWQNPVDAADVSTNQEISPLDALMVINALNTLKSRVLNSGDLDLQTRPDVSGDGALSPIDALLVINRLNLRSTGNAEGELASPSSSVLWHYTFIDEIEPLWRRKLLNF